MTASEIKFVKSLSQKKFRDECGLFVVEGEKMVSEALSSGFEVVDVYRAEEVGPKAMERISSMSTPSPVLAVVRKPTAVVPEIRNGLYLGLDGIRDPGNMGTILRIADWFGVEAVLATEDSVDIFNPKVVQATMGAIFRVKFHYVDLVGEADRFDEVYGTFLDGKDMYREDLKTGSDSPVLLVIGNESNGISAGMGSKTTSRLYIPPFPPDETGSESLNAAVATAIAVAEFRRRLAL